LSRSTFAPFDPGDPDAVRPVSQVEGILDLDGDGLADHWRLDAYSNNAPLLLRNDGLGFNTAGVILTQRPGNEGRTDVWAYDSSTGWIYQGVRTDTVRTYDIDLDGHVDLLREPQTEN